MESPPPPPIPPFQILPKPTELAQTHMQYLDQNFTTHHDLLTRAPSLLSDLTKHCADSEAHLLHLHRLLSKSVVSWISRSFSFKSSFRILNLALENLSLLTSQYGIGSRKIHKVLTELPQLAKQLRLIESIRKYVDTALKLEALVGDLEDAVFCVEGRHARNMFTPKFFTSLISTDFGSKQERLVQAIKVMNDIEEILVDLAKFQPQWCHLLESVDIRVNKNLAVVRPQVLADHRALLASLGWPPKLLTSKVDNGEIVGLPNPLLLMEGEKRKYYSQSFLALCALQHLQTRREDRQHNTFKLEGGMTLWAIDELVSPIASRIEYHLSKWADYPEFMFALVYKITGDFIVGVDDVLQPLIDKARLVSCSAKEAWVSAMIQMLSGFLAKSVFPVLAEKYKAKHLRPEVSSSWLHLMDHIVVFDKRMQSLLSSETHLFFEEFDRIEGVSKDLSALTMFCNRSDWLKIWAKIELKDAWKKLKVELKDERAWSTDKKSKVDIQSRTESEQFFLISTREDYKAPLIAESALKIAWTMIERSQTLLAVLPRIQFIRSTAARFFWYFLNVLVLRCKTAEFALDYADDALIKICGSINAARYIESKLQEWSDDVNFLEMRIAEEDSHVDRNNYGPDNRCFFGEEIKSLLELATNWLMDMISALFRYFETLSWEYLQDRRHFEQEQGDLSSNRILATMDLALSVDIIQALDTIKSKLHLLRLNLNPKDFLDLWRSVAEGLDHFISRTILENEIQFSSEGSNQFGADMRALLLVFQPFCARPEAFFPCIREILKLLKMSKEEANHHFQVVVNNNGRNGSKCLQLCGISHLSVDHVVKVLKNRKF